MASWFARLMRAGATPDGLARRLADYPPYRAPHAGPPRRWSPAQARENLADLLAHRDERLALLTGLLREYGIDPGPALAGGDPLPLVDQLHAWAETAWRTLRHADAQSRKRWVTLSREGIDIAFSLALDVALLLGELIRRGDPRWTWALDEDPGSRRDDMFTAMRPVLLLPGTVAGMPDFPLDLEEIVVHRYLRPDDSGRVLNPWHRVVADALARRYDLAP